MKRLLLGLLLASVVVTACGGEDDMATGTIQLVSPAEASTVLDDPGVVLLDIRTAQEVAVGRIAGSTNIDFYADDFAAQIAELDRDTTYVVYCRSGNRSGQAMSVFDELGFTEVYDVDGGIVAWAEAGFGIE